MTNILFTPEGRAFSKALATVSHLDTAVERAKRTLNVNIRRNRNQPHAHWRTRIAECRAEVARLEADREEARQAYEQAQAALSVVRESLQVAA
jgi:predicted negative regulator of RcsB-dependent stress response